MAKFNITNGSVKLIGDVKTGMEVTFIADSGESAKQYYEVESVDKDEIEQALQKAADEYAAKLEVPQVVAPSLETGKAMEVQIAAPVL